MGDNDHERSDVHRLVVHVLFWGERERGRGERERRGVKGGSEGERRERGGNVPTDRPTDPKSFFDFLVFFIRNKV